jgi:prepilin-type N-terminal cleavage/methylation domain-containing protein
MQSVKACQDYGQPDYDAAMWRPKGFTLVELLVVIGIIAMLAALIFPVLGNLRTQGDRVAATSNLRQIGAAILLCTGDRDGLLPGPLQVGQKSAYSTNTKQLACLLAPYLDVQEPAPNQTLKVFFAPAFARAMRGKDPSRNHPFLLKVFSTVNEAEIAPFGSDVPGKESAPMKISAVGANVQILRDADQEDPEVAKQPWASGTPKTIIHGRERLGLHLDGSVRNDSKSGPKGSTPPPPPPPPKPPPPPPPPPPP